MITTGTGSIGKTDVDEFADKYKTASSGIGKFLIDGFYKSLGTLIASTPAGAKPGSRIFEVGCGTGESTSRIASMLPVGVHFETSDYSQELVEYVTNAQPDIPCSHQSVYDLQLADNSVDLIIMLEVLEHLDDYDKALQELGRVSKLNVLISVPREPIWSVLNMSRGKYLAHGGNTPGHVNRWSTRGIQSLARKHGFTIIKTATPLPWTQILLQK